MKNIVISDEVLTLIFQAIDDEPELPGEMPEETYQLFLKANKEAIADVFRIVVRATKEGIKDRVQSLYMNPPSI